MTPVSESKTQVTFFAKKDLKASVNEKALKKLREPDGFKCGALKAALEKYYA